jgi:hypothetical protein
MNSRHNFRFAFRSRPCLVTPVSVPENSGSNRNDVEYKPIQLLENVEESDFPIAKKLIAKSSPRFARNFARFDEQTRGRFAQP